MDSISYTPSFLEYKIPSSFECEVAVLDVVLNYSGRQEQFFTAITNDSFFTSDTTRNLYLCFQKLRSECKPIELVSVTQNLLANGLNEVFKFVMDKFNGGTFDHYFDDHLKLLTDLYIKRSSIMSSHKAINSLAGDNDPIKVINTLQNEVLELSNLAKNDIKTHDEVFKDIHSKAKNMFLSGHIPEKVGVTTGLKTLDEMIELEAGKFYIIAARPAMGKTSLVINSTALAIAKSGLPVLIFSLEMDKQELFDRIVASELGISTYYLKRGILPSGCDLTAHDVALKIEEIRALPLIIEDSIFEFNQIRNKALELKNKHGQLGAIIIDYLQLIDFTGQEHNKVQELTQITKRLKRLSKTAESNAPVIALSQLSRKLEERQNKRPMLSDLRESGSIEQDADLVAFIYRDSYYNPDNEDEKNKAEIIISKYRGGPVGTLSLGWNGTLTQFYDLVV